MGKNHASQYANFGSLQKKCLFSVKYDSFTDIQTLVGILKAIILEYITSYIL